MDFILEKDEIKTEFKSQAKEECEHEEHYAFLIENDHQINEVVQNGYQCQESNYNVIGQSKSGVYLCKYPDVALRFNELNRYPDHFSLKMILFKICYGKQTLALVRKDAKLAPIPATLNFSSHMSVIAPKESDNIETQFDHSQIFLYEYDSNKIPSKRPRHCLPYAVVTWLRTDESNEWPVSFTDLEIIPQCAQTNGQSSNEKNDNDSETKAEQTSAVEPSEEACEEKKDKIDDQTKEDGKSDEEKQKETNGQTQEEEAKKEVENTVPKIADEPKVEQVSASPKQENQNGTTTPNSNQAQSSTPNGTPIVSTTPNGTVKAATNAYPKPTAYTAYRHALPSNLSPFVYQPSSLGIRLPYAAAQIPQSIGGLHAQSFLNHSIQSPLQQQVFLCRGPNGLTYVTAAPGLVQQQQLVAAQQAQAQAIFQQQILQAQAQQQAAAMQKIPANHTININGQLYQTSAQTGHIQQAQQSPQIIYQAAPQLANQKAQQPMQQSSNPPQQQQAPQTQSPKSASSQMNGQAAVLAYNGQSAQQMYAPSPSAQAAIATQQGYMLAGNNLNQNQNQQLQQLQQLQQQQLLNYQLASGALGLNGFSAQGAGQAQVASGQNLGSVPVGYQLIDYRQLQGLQGTVSLDQLTGIQRNRLLQARHHPYQRP